jgi:hypothetical protein
VNRLLAALLALTMIAGVAACGRKADPEAPGNVDPRFPRSYPGSAPSAPASPAAPPAAPQPANDDNFIPRTTP